MGIKRKQTINVANYLRHHKGLTIEQVSQHTGVSPMCISRLENGNISTSIDKLQSLARFFSVSVDALVRNDFLAAAKSRTEPSIPKHAVYEQQREANERRLLTGLSGEQWVYTQELQRLEGTDFANAVCPNFSNDPESGFDLLTVSSGGEPIIVKVKATTGGPDTQFYLSAGELVRLKSSVDGGVPYHLHRVYYVDEPDKIGQLTLSAEELLTKYEFIPMLYKVKRRS